MDRGQLTGRGIWVARGGSGDRLLVLLHGMGANASVWERLLPLIERSWRGRWLAPDLRGHGRSAPDGPYGFGVHAADVAGVIEAEPPGAVFVPVDTGNAAGTGQALLVTVSSFRR